MVQTIQYVPRHSFDPTDTEKLSIDKIGRKPVIMAGTLGVALSTMYFSLSSSLTELLVSRAIGGLFGGTVAVVQSVVGEVTDGEI
jgi:MFS family permease